MILLNFIFRIIANFIIHKDHFKIISKLGRFSKIWKNQKKIIYLLHFNRPLKV